MLTALKQLLLLQRLIVLTIFIFCQENLARLQRAFARKWEFIFMQAEAQVKWVILEHWTAPVFRAVEERALHR